MVVGRQSIVAQPGRSLQLNCTGVGSPPPTNLWWRNGRVVSDGDDVRQSDGILTIDNFSADDADAYTCVSHNSGGEDRDTMNVLAPGRETNHRSIQCGW